MTPAISHLLFCYLKSKTKQHRLTFGNSRTKVHPEVFSLFYSFKLSFFSPKTIVVEDLA